MIKSTGIIDVSPGRISVNIHEDLVKYYRQLIYWEFPNLIGGLSFSRHRPHITIVNPKLHIINESNYDWIYGNYNKKRVEFEYDPTQIYLGGFRKNFVGFYIKIFSLELDKLRKCAIVSELKESGGESERDSSLHLTICTSKGYKI